MHHLNSYIRQQMILFHFYPNSVECICQIQPFNPVIIRKKKKKTLINRKYEVISNHKSVI